MAAPSAETFDAIVVGSGFGGAVAAWRFAQAGLRTLVLERGRPYPPGSFPRTPYAMGRNFWDPSEGLQGLYDIWSFRTLEAIVASGVGGGSLIYANVLIRKDAAWFVGEDGRPWPVSREDLEPHYDAVETALRPQVYPFATPPYDRTGKTAVMKEAAQALGLDWRLPPLAVLFGDGDASPVPGAPITEPFGNLHGAARRTCRLCGECDIGCNEGAKNSTDFAFLSEACRGTAELRARCEVRDLRPIPDGYEVRYVVHDPAREGRPFDTSRLPLVAVRAPVVVLAAGTLGSTQLLLRSRAAFPAISARLGHGFSGNGDVLAFATGCVDDDGQARAVDPAYGPVITSTVRYPDALDGGAPAGARGTYIQDGGFPNFVSWAAELSDFPAMARRAVVLAVRYLAGILRLNPDSNLSAEISHVVGSAGLTGSTLTLLGMGRDVAGGQLTLGRRWLDLDWPRGPSRRYFDDLHAHMTAIAEANGAKLVDNPLRRLGRTITVHPLGGCAMGHDPESGVVDSHGQVFGYPGLYVADGAVMPGAVGANPSLTIAALAHRFAGHAVERARPRT